MQPAKHFTIDDLIANPVAARLGIDNRPPAHILERLAILADGLEMIQTVVRAPIQILYAYGSPELNAAMGGGRHSAHMDGLAADIRVPGMSPFRLATFLSSRPLRRLLDQVILSFPERPADTWVHIGFSSHPRGEVLTRRGSPAWYMPGLPPCANSSADGA